MEYTEDNAENVPIVADMFAKNKHDRERSMITFVGGPADGETFNLPNGVKVLTVDSSFGPIAYYRSEEKPDTFTPEHP